LSSYPLANVPVNTSRPRPILALMVTVLALLLVPPAWAQRVALVIGNAAYTDRPLRNPVNDAQLMQTTLRELGFHVQVATDVDRRGLLSALRDFEARARGADVALFYFAGHGAQVGGANYLIPVNAPIRSETDVPDEALDASSVLRRIEEGRARVGLVILDACRDNPFPGSARSSTRGLARMGVPTGSIVAYATAPGSTAEDGTGSNGTYTAALARYLKTPGLDIKEVFDRTAQEVEKETDGNQRPREEIGLRGRFVLNDAAGASGLASVTPMPQGQAGGINLSDLAREQQAREAWADWQRRMQTDFESIGAIKAPDLRVQAWQRFLGAWKDDNPTDGEDDRLREQAQMRLAEAQAQHEARASEERLRAPLAAVPAGSRLALTAGGASAPGGLTSAVSGEDAERKAWEVAMRGDTRAAYEEYLRAYPQGRFAFMAGAALATFRLPVTTATATVGAVVSVPGAGVPSPAAQASEYFKDCLECPEMVVIQAGSFLMGSPPNEAGRLAAEGPRRLVDVPRFAMGKYEVTQGQWQAVMGGNPSTFEDCGLNCPVENVSWNDAQEFVRRLNQRTGQNYRLPSEAEWEYAARAGTTTAYFWGDGFNEDRANNSSRTVQVGSYPANAFGLHDMQGNVWEWVQDVWHDNYAGAPHDGSAWTTGGDLTRRVLRGGACMNSPRCLRSASRSRNVLSYRFSSTGFRIARTL
jgi:formylglycine-generating enzyme required for sulfatase activity